MQRLFKALSSAQRIRIIEFLLRQEDFICYCEMEHLIDRDRSVLYRHIHKLDAVGLLDTRRKGRRIECRLKDKESVSNILQSARRLIENED